MLHSSLPVAFNSSTGLHGSVLVIENDALICEVVNEILSATGIKVYTAHDGLEGEEIYRNHQDEIDVVILDWRLPKQNGRETLHHIRQLNPDAQILISSGHSPEELSKQLGDQQAVTFLSKPFSVDTLLNQVTKLLA
jgi:DNA-binding response OmpR family regulator